MQLWDQGFGFSEIPRLWCLQVRFQFLDPASGSSSASGFGSALVIYWRCMVNVYPPQSLLYIFFQVNDVFCQAVSVVNFICFAAMWSDLHESRSSLSLRRADSGFGSGLPFHVSGRFHFRFPSSPCILSCSSRVCLPPVFNNAWERRTANTSSRAYCGTG